MSVNYASGLSPFPDKGECGQPETFDSPGQVEEKCRRLAEWIRAAEGAVVVHTGAGISTACGIPDFRGPRGVWTLEKRGEEPDGAISFTQARPSLTHMALVAMETAGLIRAVITQNVDGLHLRSGFPRNRLAILHGDMFTEECELCHSLFLRSSSVPTMGLKRTGGRCGRRRVNALGQCRGRLRDTILDWEDSLPDTDLDFAREQSKAAVLSLCLGTSLQIVPGGELPLLTKQRRRAGRRGRPRRSAQPEEGTTNGASPEPSVGRIAIVNLQPTKRDKDCDLKIHAYVDQVIGRVCELLDVSIPSWTEPKLVLLSQHSKPKEKFKWNLVLSPEKPLSAAARLDDEAATKLELKIFSKSKNEASRDALSPPKSKVRKVLCSPKSKDGRTEAGESKEDGQEAIESVQNPLESKDGLVDTGEVKVESQEAMDGVQNPIESKDGVAESGEVKEESQEAMDGVQNPIESIDGVAESGEVKEEGEEAIEIVKNPLESKDGVAEAGEAKEEAQEMMDGVQNPIESKDGRAESGESKEEGQEAMDGVQNPQESKDGVAESGGVKEEGEETMDGVQNPQESKDGKDSSLQKE